MMRSWNRRGLKSRSPRKTSLLKPRHMKDRLNFGIQCKYESKEIFHKVIPDKGPHLKEKQKETNHLVNNKNFMTAFLLKLKIF